MLHTLFLIMTLPGFASDSEWTPGPPPPVPPPEGETPVQPPEPQKKWDCLGGVCLNDRTTSTYPKVVVTVSDRRWTRTVEVCSGRVVKVQLATGWHQTYFKWTDLLPGTSTKVGDDEGVLADSFRDQILSALVGKGWVLGGEGLMARGASHPDVKGKRIVISAPADENALSGWNGWLVGLVTNHPDKEALCKSKYEQGL